ncbi:hypothetical protein KAT92_03060 [Candidatus Babeliales bacterium]|nr:hypothetical protein [Candidatus Babeliales bacterium]
MKRLIIGMLAALVACGSVSPKTYTNKSFFTPRNHLTNIAMEQTTWHKQTALIDEDKFGGSVQATGFYEASENQGDLGKFFGVKNYWNGNSIDDFIEVEQWAANGANSFTHLYAEDVFHRWTASSPAAPWYVTNPSKLADRIKLRPYRDSYGIRLDYHQKLDKIVDGLFFKVSLPLVHVKTSLDYSSTTSHGYGTKQKLAINQALNGDEKSFIDYLTGNVANTDAHNAQNALTKMKFHNGNDETGVADIDFTLGYNFLYENKKHLNASIGLTIPTGSDPDGNFLWEAIVGNGGHYAVGAGMDGAFEIWKDEDMSLDIVFGFNYRYLLKASETRCPGFKVNTGTTEYPKEMLFGRYILGGKIGQVAGTALEPLANLITRDFNVTPGSHFDGMVDFAFNWSDFTFDLGYNLFAKTAEHVSWKGEEIHNVYGTANWGYRVDNAVFTANNALTKDDYLLDTITHPSVVTHKIFSGIGYAYNGWEYPIMFGIGGSYEFDTDNDALQTWSLYGKFGLTF